MLVLAGVLGTEGGGREVLTPGAILVRILVCATSSRMEKRLSFPGSNRRALYPGHTALIPSIPKHRTG